MSEDRTFWCRVCQNRVHFAIEAPVRLRVRQLYEEPTVCAECRAHMVSVRKQISEAQMDATRWATANAKALDPASPYTLLAYGRSAGDRVECPFCFSRGTHSFGYLIPNGLHMHLGKCFVFNWMEREDSERTQRRKEQQLTVAQKKHEKRVADDFLYLIENKKARTVKIGVSNNPKKRMQALQSAVGMPLNIVGTICLLDAYGKERELHYRLSQLRLHGEWFTDVPEVRNAFFEVADHANAA